MRSTRPSPNGLALGASPRTRAAPAFGAGIITLCAPPSCEGRGRPVRTADATNCETIRDSLRAAEETDYNLFMAKYDPLREYLCGKGGRRIGISFDQIAGLVGGLPRSAYEYQA